MPRHLLLIRHARAGDAPLDRDRPLTAHGERDAELIGARLSRHGPVPDRVLVSPARRAVETWSRAAAALPPAPAPVVAGRIYENTVEDLLALIRETPDEAQTLALVGHNPSIGALAHELDDGLGDQALRRLLHRGFPAGGLAMFELGTPFADVAAGTATLRGFRPPAG